MRKKQSWLFLIATVFLIVILTALFAGDNKKLPKVFQIEQVGINAQQNSFSKRDFIEKLNKDPQYSHLSAPEKVRVIVETLRKEKELQSEKKLSKIDRNKGKNYESLDSKKY